MSVLKKKPAQSNPRSKRPRAEHSGFLRRFHGEKPGAAALSVETSQPAAATRETLLPLKPAGEAEIEPSLRALTRTRSSLVLAQTLVQRLGIGRPWAVVELKITTALRGTRQVEGLTETAYLFRLEVVKTSPGVKLEGFNLGPWRAEGLDLEAGNIFVAEPLWTGFQAQAGKLRGRIRLADTVRQSLLDCPWVTEALVPGPEPI